MKQLNYGTLVFFSDKKFQHLNKWYAVDYHNPITTFTNQVPPFQHSYDIHDGNIISFKLHNEETGSVTEIANDLVAAGLRHETYQGSELYPDHKKVIYPSTSKFPGTFREGLYYAEMRTASSIWYSEYFVMRNYIGDDHLYIEWSHADKFPLPPSIGHTIDYSENYKNFLYFKSEIGKPTYPYEEEYLPRNGYQYPVHQVSFKIHKFQIIVSEYYADIIRMIPLHDCVVIRHMGVNYDVDKFDMNDPEWFPSGAWGNVICEFRYDTISVVSGRGLVDKDSCGVGKGECYAVDYNVVSTIDFDSPEREGYYYLDENNNQVALQDQDYIFLKQTDGDILLYRYNAAGPNYQIVSPSVGQIAYDSRNDQYYQATGLNNTWITNNITSATETEVTGTAVDGGMIEIIGINGTVETTIAIITPQEFRDGYTSDFSAYEALKIKVYTSTCGVVFESNGHYFDPTPITPDLPEPDLTGIPKYSDEAAAIIAGLENGDLYLQDPNDSTGGLPGCVVRMVLHDDPNDNPYPVVLSGTDVSFIGRDTPYVFGVGNEFGVSPGTMYMINKGFPQYLTPQDAANAGVQPGEPYLLSGRQYGFDRFGVFIAIMDC